MNAFIRRAAESDAELLTVMGMETFTRSWSFFYTPEMLQHYLDENYTVEKIRRELISESITYYVAFCGDVPAGFLRLCHRQTLVDWITAPCMELSRVYVYEQFQGQRIGQRLIEQAIETARESGMNSIVLGVWEHNHHAVKIYERLGFEKIGEHEFIVHTQTDTDWVMEKKL